MLKKILKCLQFFSLTCISCSGLEQTEYDKVRQHNLKGEFIYRKHDEAAFSVLPAEYRQREEYPWEEHFVGNHPRITKSFFTCKGGKQVEHPSAPAKDGVVPISDCNGQHSLPIREGKEFIYPILIDLLNFIQAKTGKRVIITCGHRCPQHNRYADSTGSNQASKHMIGAEVDFYVQGMEYEPEVIIQLILDFYMQAPNYKDKTDYCNFQREKSNSLVLMPWANKEISIKLYGKNEGRDFDNQHPYPYICIAVRFDRSSQQKVIYSKEQAYNYQRS
ncbi:MAG: hypothetical protein K0S74_1175 [Chlamydiales bacterium]|jgi:hypothetical protein|nr:hypothetical protein [Chlamydiales bacterium]